jgi:GT2 family glycosyltransferase
MLPLTFVEDLMPDIAIVTPSLRQGAFIDRTLASVHSQGVRLEHVVADAGSLDGTVDLLRTWEKRSGGALRWWSAPDKGQSNAVNRAIAATSAPIIGWINSDDVYGPGALAAVLSHFHDHPDCEVVYGDAQHISADDAVIEPYPIEDWNPARLRDTCFICQPALFFTRRLFERIGPLNESLHFCMDYEYWLRLARAGVVPQRLRQVLAGSRLHQDTKTIGGRVKVHTEINDMMLAQLGTVPDLWIHHWAHAQADDWGIERGDTARFAQCIALLSLTAALRWNRVISPVVAANSAAWSPGLKQIWKHV